MGGQYRRAEVLEGEGRYLYDIINGVWGLAEVRGWVAAPHLNQNAGMHLELPDPEEEPYVDLAAADVGSILSWAYYLFQDQFDTESPQINRILKRELLRRIEKPILEGNFWWMGLDGGSVNNWNPWIISNVLMVFLTVEEDEEIRLKGAEKCLRCLDHYINQQYEDGGCDEGPIYWTVAAGALFDALEILYDASEGRIDIFDGPLLKKMGSYIYKVNLTGNCFANFSDAEREDFDLNPTPVFRYGTRVKDPKMMEFAAAIYKDYASKIPYPITGTSFYRQIKDLFTYPELMRYQKASYPMERDNWQPSIQVLVTRQEAGSSRGLTLAAKGGHNAESHNHNDIGSFLLLADGKAVLIDLGRGDYTKDYFSPKRYEIWVTRSIYHNTPTVRGIEQHEGREYSASDLYYAAGGKDTLLSMELAGAYPAEAGIESWKRTFACHREGKFLPSGQSHCRRHPGRKA